MKHFSSPYNCAVGFLVLEAQLDRPFMHSYGYLNMIGPSLFLEELFTCIA